jgi:hypothetical protein
MLFPKQKKKTENAVDELIRRAVHILGIRHHLNLKFLSVVLNLKYPQEVHMYLVPATSPCSAPVGDVNMFKFESQ